MKWTNRLPWRGQSDPKVHQRAQHTAQPVSCLPLGWSSYILQYPSGCEQPFHSPQSTLLHPSTVPTPCPIGYDTRMLLRQVGDAYRKGTFGRWGFGGKARSGGKGPRLHDRLHVSSLPLREFLPMRGSNNKRIISLL